jgi:integrase
MAKAPLTNVQIRTLKPPVIGQIEVWDGKIPGFGLRVSKGGAKSFILLYRHKDRPRRLTLGRYPILSLADARTQAQVALREVYLGNDPSLKGGDKNGDGGNGFDTAVDEFIEKYARLHTSGSRETSRVLKKEFAAHWGSRPVSSITKQDVTAIIDGIVGRGAPIMAHRAFGTIRRFFNWQLERGLIEKSPCFGLKAPVKRIPRHRTLSDRELTLVCEEVLPMGYPYAPIIWLLALTAQRRGEVAGMRWDDLDFEKALWSIPPELNKSRRPHVVPLTPMVLEILKTLPMLHPVLVFPAHGVDNVVANFSRWKVEHDRLCGVSGWRVHDLRRTAATGLAKLQVPPHVIERILNHTMGGVAGIYNRFGYLPEMSDALQRWASHVHSFLGGWPRFAGAGSVGNGGLPIGHQDASAATASDCGFSKSLRSL